MKLESQGKLDLVVREQQARSQCTFSQRCNSWYDGYRNHSV